MKSIRSIQYLRAVAALMVVLFHVLTRDHIRFGVGAAGVDIFFVISGFIMWKVSEFESTPKRFISRRIIRIVPLYWGVTLLLAFCAIVLPGKIFRNLTVDTVSVIKSLLFVPYGTNPDALFPILAPGWTLNFEMAFYVLFAGCLLAPRKWQLPIMTAVMMVSVLLRFVVTSKDPLFVTYTSPIILEFVAGAWLAEAVNRGVRISVPISALLILGGVVAFAAQEILRVRLDPLFRFLWWGGAAFVIVTGAIMIEFAGRMPTIALLKPLGDASYSIYLLHGLVVSAMLPVLGRFGPVVLAVAVLIVSCVVGYVCFRFFEKPLTSWLRRAVEGRGASARRVKDAPAGSPP